MKQQLLNYLKQIATLNQKEEAYIQEIFQEKEYQKGSFILEEGKVCRLAGFIQKGVVRYFINQDGEEKTYAFSKENDFVSNYESFVSQTPSKIYIQALEDTVLYVVSFAEMQDIYKQIRSGEKIGRLIIEQIFIQTLQDLRSFYTDTPEQRYQFFLEKHPDLQQRISQYHIASYVGVKPQSLSRIRKRITQKE